MTTITGIGPQLDRAAAGTDPRGILVFAYLPDDLQRAEQPLMHNHACLLNRGNDSRRSANNWIRRGPRLHSGSERRSRRCVVCAVLGPICSAYTPRAKLIMRL